MNWGPDKNVTQMVAAKKGEPKNGVREWQNFLNNKFPNWKGQIPNHQMSMVNLPICKPC